MEGLALHRFQINPHITHLGAMAAGRLLRARMASPRVALDTPSSIPSQSSPAHPSARKIVVPPANFIILAFFLSEELKLESYGVTE